MTELNKGKSPFYPGQPVPVEFFVGRTTEIDKILTRGAGQVARGKQIAMFTQGEYGIGKSSIASFVQYIAERDYKLHSIYATLGGCSTLDDVSLQILIATLRSGALDFNRSEEIKNWLGKYVGDQSLFGIVNLNFSELRKDAPSLSTPYNMLDFLAEANNRISKGGYKGIFLVLDEINGMTSNVKFANFLKGLVDSNAISKKPLPLLLMLCGVEERRRELIQKHQPIERIFDIIQIDTLSQSEMKEFFKRAFESVQMTINDDALEILIHFSAGFPKIMHLIGDSAFWIDSDNIIDAEDAASSVMLAAEEVGKKYVDKQVFSELHSKDYKAILNTIGKMDPGKMSFKKSEVEAQLTEVQKNKFHNFLQKMKKLNVLRGKERGEYIFNMRMVRLYIWLQTQKSQKNFI
ncbi:MAG: hypothetical protein JXA92_07895 [candidate division Zixibacteria bacterium]|nr:hypothetical protein [candidate division Zixibacteria bacterium]